MQIFNRQYKRDYLELDTYEAGLVLSGEEVKSIRAGRIQLEEAHIKFVANIPMLINAHISLYAHSSRGDEYDPIRSRQLLLNKKEIIALQTKLHKEPRLTIVPKKCYTTGRHIKLEIGLVRGKRAWERISTEKEKTVKREQEKEIKARE